MYKKIVLILSALIVLSLPYQQQYAEGAILSKVATASAKKAIKEIIKDAAVETAIDLVANSLYEMSFDEQSKYQKQQDYELFCGKKMPDLITCEKPMQVKSVLSQTDKVNIGNQSEIELDKLITNGAGFTKWQKFLDWFIPIWGVSFLLTAITYVMDPDVKSLINEAGYNALVALGMIAPVVETGAGNLKETPITTTDDNGYETLPDGTTKYHFTRTTPLLSGTGQGIANKLNNINVPYENMIVQTIYSYNEPGQYSRYYFHDDNTSNKYFGYDTLNIYLGHPTHFTNPTVVVHLNGETIYDEAATLITGDYVIPKANLLQFETTIQKKIKSIQHRSPYVVGGFYYTDTLYNTVDGNVLEIQVKSSTDYNKTMPTASYVYSYADMPTAHNIKTSILQNRTFDKKILVPNYTDVETSIQPLDNSDYIDEDGKVALIPPSALPYTQTSTGVQLTPEVGNDGEPKFTTPNGESIPEDDITVGEPTVQDNPSPQPNTVTPPVTSINPNPEPIPLTPGTPTTIPTPIKPPVETEAPIFPEGESCEQGLKFPKFKQLGETVSHGFPFSLPFDIYRGWNNVFSGIGTEKPEFEYKLNFMGEQQIWEIGIPDYFDSWKKFTDILLVVIFDISLLYLFNRFFGAHGSD